MTSSNIKQAIDTASARICLLESINKQFVIDSLYKANMAVKEKITSPEVYACLHLFGNPFLQIADKPVLEISEKE